MMRKRLADLVSSPQWEGAIVLLVVLNAITLGLETSDRVMAAIGPVLLALDKAFLVVFVLEIAIRILARGPRFFLGAWNLFDFTIVAIALIPASGPFTVLRALRILRVLRLISVVPSLRRVIGGLVAALPGMGSIVVLMALVFYVFSVMATKLYGETFPEWFGTIAKSLYTLFQVMTLESWSMGIVRPVMDVHPWSWLFFIPFILCTAFTVLNLFIGIIVSAMQEEHEHTADEDRRAIHTEAEHILAEVRALRREMAELRESLGERPDRH